MFEFFRDLSHFPIAEESDKENVVVRPKRQRYRHRRHGFHEEFGRPHSTHSESNIRSSWVEKTPNAYPTISQEMLAAFCAPVNSLEAVDSSFARKPDRPVRSKKGSEDHLYSNVAPRRAKRGQRKTLTDSSNDMKTWPRRSAEKPVVPKRCKKPVFSVCTNYQTWPRRSMAQSPPTAPKRTRSRNQMNCKTPAAANLQDLEDQIEMPTTNILTEADTLFGAESRFIDEEADADRSLQRARSSNSCAQLELNIIPGESGQAKILNSSPRPLKPARNKGGSLRKPKRASTYGEGTWPRMSKAPSAPQRRKQSLKKKELEEPLLPTVPASTPSEEVHEISYQLDGESSSSAQAGLDQILEILASTFPQETTPQEENNEQVVTAEAERVAEADFSPVDLHQEEEMVDENPYAEIKHFQNKRAPPPRPPPPIYAPASASSYSYIYTVPRRKKGISNSVSPERPPRTYCTIRPHRPPRKSRTRTQEIVFQLSADELNAAPRRHSFSGGDDPKEERDLQSAPVVERMRARPLPAPPRSKKTRSRSPPNKPPRSRTASLKRLDDSSLPVEDVPIIEEIAAPETALQQQAVDEYEPIENPVVQVEEISVGIQTDPLPEYDESVVEMPSDEINNNLYDQHEPVMLERPVQQVAAAPVVLEETVKVETCCPPTVWSAANSPDPEPEIIESVSVQQELAPPVKTSASKPSVSPRNRVKEEDDETDSYSQIPAHFLRSIAPLPPIQVDLPTRLHLSDLDVERLNVREVMAERLIVSSVDTNSLQVNKQII